MKYVSDSNLSRFLTKLKGIFAKKSEVPSQADVDSKLPLAGGTMTGSIVINNSSAYIKSSNNRDILKANSSGDTTVGNNLSGLQLHTQSQASIIHQRGSMQYIVLDEYNTAANPTLAGTEAALTGLKLNGTSYKNQPASVSYLTTAPSSANTDGLKIVVLASESGVTKQSGYLYIFTGA